MSRLDSNSPVLSCLPRRRFLKALTAVPQAAVAVPEPGQAFSDHLATAIAADERFARFDQLASEIVDLDLRQEEAFEEYDEETIAWCTEESDEDGPSPWVVLHNSLVDDMSEFAKANRHPPRDTLDVILQWKIADYYFAVGDVGFDEVNESCPMAARHALEFLGVRPQVPIEELRAQTPIHIAVTEEFASRTQRTPHAVNAGNLILKIRQLGKGRRSECRMAELETLRDEIIVGANRPSTEWSENDPYRMTQVHLFTVWVELIDALRPGFLNDESHGAIAPVLRQLRKEAAYWDDTFIDHATRWNAEQGGANV